MSLETVDIYRMAKKVVEEFAHIKQGENVCIMTDTKNTNIADALAAASHALGADTVVFIMLPLERDGEQPPAVAAAAMQTADVVIESLYRTMDYSEGSGIGLKAGGRRVILKGLSEDKFVEGAVQVDYQDDRKVVLAPR